MGNNQHHLAHVGNGAQVLHQCAGHDAIETRVGLVKEEQRRIAHQLHGNRETLSLTARETSDQRVPLALEAKQLPSPDGSRQALRMRCALGHAKLRRGKERVAHRIVATQQVLLRHVANLVLDAFILGIDVGIAQHDAPVRLAVAHHRVDEGRLARA